MPENTAKKDPMELLATAMIFGPSGAIEHMEALGQIQLVNEGGTKLPFQGCNDPAWSKMGITFPEEKSDDPIFVNARLPDGWKIVATDHNMHSTIVDDKGRERGNIFYKAAHYDRSAHMRPYPRFWIDYVDMHGNYSSDAAVVKDRADGNNFVVRYTGDKPEEQCCVYMEEKFPLWRDVAAYWDET